MHSKHPLSRVIRTKAEARAGYDRLSGWYDLLAGGAEKKCREAGLQLLAVRSGERVLEVGSGTGEGVLPLARSAGAAGSVTGVDLSPRMCRAARLKAARAGLAGQAVLVCADAARLPCTGDRFDALFACFTLELFDTPEIPVVLAECRRVLRPGGRLCAVTMAQRDARSLASALYDWAHAQFPRFADCRPIRARGALEEAGFTVEQVQAVSLYGLPVDIVLARNTAQLAG